MYRLLFKSFSANMTASVAINSGSQQGTVIPTSTSTSITTTPATSEFPEYFALVRCVIEEGHKYLCILVQAIIMQ